MLRRERRVDSHLFIHWLSTASSDHSYVLSTSHGPWLSSTPNFGMAIIMAATRLRLLGLPLPFRQNFHLCLESNITTRLLVKPSSVSNFLHSADIRFSQENLLCTLAPIPCQSARDMMAHRTTRNEPYQLGPFLESKPPRSFGVGRL